MKASEVLREAKNVLFERGWYQGYYHDGDKDAGAVCLRAAVSVADCGAVFGALYGTPATNALQLAIPESTISTWNDSRGRTFDDAVDALDRAEKLALIREESDA